MKQQALIYCRVSSQRQVDEGNGNQSQEQRCRQYAQARNYIVKKVFLDEGISGGLFERPAMKLLIDYLDNHQEEKFIIIFDDLSRFARKLDVHLKLRTELKDRGAKLECLNFNFEDSPEGIFIENVLASKSQLDREQNRRQVIQKMKARIEMGFWPFCMPAGLINKKDEIKGKVLVPRQPFASIYKEAIEKYRDNMLNTLQEVRDFIIGKYKENNIDKPLSFNGAKNILSEELYCGYIEYKPWDIPFKKGQHEGFISLETYKIVQIKLEGKAKPRLRKDYNDDFPLRPFVLCGTCNKPLTASWNKGRNGRYPNYWCKNKACQYCYKSISRALIEAEFENLLIQIKPREEILELTKEIMIDLWNNKKDQLLNQNTHIYEELEKIDIEIGNLAKRLGKITTDSVFNICEQQISKLDNKKKEVLKGITEPEIYTTEKFGTASKKVFSVLKQPTTIWRNENLEIKRTILYMYFEKAPVYFYKKGFGTANLSLPIKLMNEAKNPKTHLVEMVGVEPTSEKITVENV